jgi:hypothetical protein
VVTARFNYVLSLPDGSTTTARVLAYYRLFTSSEQPIKSLRRTPG